MAGISPEDKNAKKTLEYSKSVIPAKAGIQKNQRTGPRPSPG
jgi:hypothetical protein